MSWLSQGLHCSLPLRGEGVRSVHGQLRRTVRQEIIIFFVNTSLKGTENKCMYLCKISSSFIFYIGRPNLFCLLTESESHENVQMSGGFKGCPGSLKDCIAACPSEVKVFEVCTANCGERCGKK